MKIGDKVRHKDYYHIRGEVLRREGDWVFLRLDTGHIKPFKVSMLIRENKKKKRKIEELWENLYLNGLCLKSG